MKLLGYLLMVFMTLMLWLAVLPDAVWERWRVRRDLRKGWRWR